MARSVDEARAAIRDILGRSGLSMRALSAAMGRDADYIAAFLDPSRRNRARPTPDDLVAASDATGIAVVELLDAVWGIPPDRLADELSERTCFRYASPTLRKRRVRLQQRTE